MSDIPIPPTGEPAKKTILKWPLTTLLLLTGALISIYLFQHYLKLSAQAGAAFTDVCSALFTQSCDNALQSGFSMQAGLPLAGWSILFYAGLTLFTLMPFLYGPAFRPVSRSGIFLLTLIGSVTAIVLLIVMWIHPALFCPLCTILHLINLGLFLHLNKLSIKSISAEARDAYSFFKKTSSNSAEKWWKLGGLISILLLFVSMYFGLRVLALGNGRNARPALIEARPILDSFYSQAPRNIPVYADDASTGSPGSKVKIVVFSDFLCPSCKKFSRELRRVIDEGKGSYFVVFKNFPLSSGCNPYSADRHPLACNAALAGVAANKQGKFWAFHDTLYAMKTSKDEDPFLAAALSAGLNEAQYTEGLRDEQAKMKISRDIEQAHQLGVNATPSVFLNGRLLKDMRPGILQFLIGQELKRLTDTSDHQTNSLRVNDTDQPKRSL